MDKISTWLIAAAICALLALGGFFWWQNQQVRKLPRFSAPTASAPQATPAPAAAASAPTELAIKHPIEAALPAKDQPMVSPASLRPGAADAYIKDALVDLLGRENVLSWLNVDNFVNRVVVTVDNLERTKAPASLRPFTPAPARLVTEQRSGGTYLSERNASRYTPFVGFVESIDTARAAALYVRLYPLFQRAYEEQGYPGRYFNDRLVEVIDHLLDTPPTTAAPKLTLTEVHGPIKLTRPWTMYEFEDPKLQARSAGQKLLLRIGPSNAQRLKAKLAEFRRQIAKDSATR